MDPHFNHPMALNFETVTLYSEAKRGDVGPTLNRKTRILNQSYKTKQVASGIFIAPKSSKTS